MIIDTIKNKLVTQAGKVFSPGGKKAKLVILTYHRILEGPDPLRQGDYTANIFDWQMKILKENFNVLPLLDAVDGLENKNLPPRAICITFDDGYADNSEIALPILKKWNLPATFFISTGFIDGGMMWNDIVIESVRKVSEDMLDLSKLELGVYRFEKENDKTFVINNLLQQLKYLPYQERVEKAKQIAESVGYSPSKNMMMTSEQIKKLHDAGMLIGAHTINHTILSDLSEQDADYEIKESAGKLANLLNCEINAFAYPNGRPNRDYKRQNIVALKRAGMKVAVSTAWGSASCGSDLLQLPRISPSDKNQTRFVLRILKTYFDRNYDLVSSQ